MRLSSLPRRAAATSSGRATPASAPESQGRRGGCETPAQHQVVHAAHGARRAARHGVSCVASKSAAEGASHDSGQGLRRAAAAPAADPSRPHLSSPRWTATNSSLGLASFTGPPPSVSLSRCSGNNVQGLRRRRATAAAINSRLSKVTSFALAAPDLLTRPAPRPVLPPRRWPRRSCRQRGSRRQQRPGYR